MKFTCDSCNAQYMIADEKVGARGVKVKCKKCGNVIIVKPLAAEQPATEPTIADPSARADAPVDDSQQPQAGDSQMGGAFDSLFGGGASAGSSADAGAFGDSFDGSASASAPAAPKPTTPAGEKEWYVAIDDAQVGPVDVAEIEARWDARELNEDSLAWKAGMPDWVPVAEVPELAYLITERPQVDTSRRSTINQPAAAAQAGASPAAAATTAAPTAAAGTLTPMTFGGAGAEAAAPIDWKPSAASALSTLVEEELSGDDDQQAAERPQESPPAGVPELGVPGFGAGDLFGGGNGGTDMGGGGGLGMPVPMGSGGPSAAWAVPESRSSSGSGGLKPVHLVAAGGGVLVVALLVLVVVLVVRPSDSGTTKAGTAPAQTNQGQTNQDQTNQGQTKPTQTNQGQTKPTQTNQGQTKPARTPPAPADDTPAPRQRTKKRREPKRERPKPPPAPPPERRAQRPAAPPGKKLDRNDILGGVKKNAKSVAPCISAAKKKNEIVPGSYTFVLDWTINTDGSVSSPKLKGPANVMSTSLPRCFASALKRWRFPASSSATPIRNFPFGPINVR